MVNDYRTASSQERMDKLYSLMESKYTVSQDQLDKIEIANTFLNISRCPRCLRLNNQGYCCMHCEGEDDED